jgi:hypothetical protein
MCEQTSFFVPNGSVSSLLWALFAVYYLGTVLVFLYTWKQYVQRAYWTDWFDVSRVGLFKKLAWKPDILDLMNNDPLSHQKRVRALISWQAFRDLIILAFAIAIWIAGIHGLHLLGNTPTKENIEIATFLIGFLSLAGAVTKVTYEWRLKARSENRQKWIEGMREVLTELIASMPWSSFPTPARVPCDL